MFRKLILAAGVFSLLLFTTGLHAQVTPPPNRGGFTQSLGIPGKVRWSWGAMGGVNRQYENEASFSAFGSVYRDLLNPAIMLVGLNFEGYVGRRGTFEKASEGWDGGARLGLFSPVARLSAGADYNFKDRQLDLILSFIHPLKRGGILVDGGSLRIDYLPGRNHSTAIGFQLPLGQPFAGKTRPRQDYAVLNDPTPPSIDYIPSSAMVDALANARDLSHWINRVTIPFVSQWDSDWEKSEERYLADMEELRAYLASDGAPVAPGPRTAEGDVRAYHREMERAFSIATSEQEVEVGRSTPLGTEVWDYAREVILEEVILPYNRLLGQKKKNDSTRGFDARASSAFYEWLTRETPVDRERWRATAYVFAQVLTMIEDVRVESLGNWEDSRFVFLPYQFALRPEEHDNQEELDALVERATRETFWSGNQAWYVENEQFQVEHARMVEEAEDYHVLWIHDFRGLNGEGNPDEIAYRHTVDVYLEALINAVERYDEVGKIPQYIILLDQWFFQANKGELFLRLLENPLHHEVDLPDGYEEWEDNLQAKQEALRQAVEGSVLLQSQALHFEEGWIENVVKVHVNITNPADVAFWTGEMLPFIGLPDMIARDHRKISFFDITEADPYKGRAMYTGMGLGEHYVGAGWEDRALMARGPAVLSLKTAARRLLLNQGFTEDQIPWELRAREKPTDYQARIDAFREETEAETRSMQVHNQVGYNFKAVNLLKATLYTLMPPGSVIKAPDSLWNLGLWGSMMLGNALRGGRSLIIAPAIEHAPSAGFPQMSRAQELLGRMVLAGIVFEDVLAESGGLIKVGLYAPDVDAGNVPGKLDQMLRTYESTPWLAQLEGFDDRTITALRELQEDLLDGGFDRKYLVPQEAVPAKLHLKAHMYATAEAWDGLLLGPAGTTFLTTAFRALAEQNAALAGQGDQAPDARTMTATITPAAEAMILNHLAELTPEDSAKAALFLLVGSHNQNHRSTIMDGEVAYVIAWWAAVHGLADFVMLPGLAVWVEDLDALEALFPRYEGMQRRLSRWMRIVV